MILKEILSRLIQMEQLMITSMTNQFHLEPTGSIKQNKNKKKIVIIMKTITINHLQINYNQKEK